MPKLPLWKIRRFLRSDLFFSLGGGFVIGLGLLAAGQTSTAGAHDLSAPAHQHGAQQHR